MAAIRVSSACKHSKEALWVAEALSAQIEASRLTLEHRSLFSAAFNRKLVRKIEILDAVRAEFLDAASRFRDQEVIGGPGLHGKIT